MENKPQKQIIYYRESAMQSIIADTYTFGVLAFMLTINYKFWAGDWYVTIFLLVIWLLATPGRTMSKMTYTDKTKLIEDLQRELVWEGVMNET